MSLLSGLRIESKALQCRKINFHFKFTPLRVSVTAIRVGGVLPDIIQPYFYTTYNSLFIACLSGIFFVALGVVAALLFNIIDRNNERRRIEVRSQSLTLDVTFNLLNL